MCDVFDEVNPFSSDRAVIVYQQKVMQSMFEGEALSEKNLSRFIKRNKSQFHKSRLMRKEWKI
jgi:hypothetical protein